jgi:hypothetical protein
MSERILNPDSLERIVAWGEQRIASGRWQHDGMERLFALRWCYWWLYLESGGCPGNKWWHYGDGGLLAQGAAGKALFLAAWRQLRRDGLICLQDGRVYPTKKSKDWDGLEELWLWLDARTPEGYPHHG